VTENGICAADDASRECFIGEHLEWYSARKREGVPLFGYLYWSLLDNFEWADGYEAAVRDRGRRLCRIRQTNDTGERYYLLTRKVEGTLAGFRTG